MAAVPPLAHAPPVDPELDAVPLDPPLDPPLEPPDEPEDPPPDVPDDPPAPLLDELAPDGLAPSDPHAATAAPPTVSRSVRVASRRESFVMRGG